MPSKKKTTKKKTVAKKTAKKQATKKAAKKTTRRKAAPKKKTTDKTCGCEKKCKPVHAFWINNGPVIHSLKELLVAMEDMTDMQYAHHTRDKKNDFANWLKDCLDEVDCARRVKKAKTRLGTARILKKRCSCK